MLLIKKVWISIDISIWLLVVLIYGHGYEYGLCSIFTMLIALSSKICLEEIMFQV